MWKLWSKHANATATQSMTDLAQQPGMRAIWQDA